MPADRLDDPVAETACSNHPSCSDVVVIADFFGQHRPAGGADETVGLYDEHGGLDWERST